MHPCHVAEKRDTLEEALALDPYSRQGDLLDCHGYASQKISCYREGLEDFEKQLLLLHPGRESACAILVGPDLGVPPSVAPLGQASVPATAPASDAARVTRRCARCWRARRRTNR